MQLSQEKEHGSTCLKLLTLETSALKGNTQKRANTDVFPGEK